jgi:hypothetical protein
MRFDACQTYLLYCTFEMMSRLSRCSAKWRFRTASSAASQFTISKEGSRSLLSLHYMTTMKAYHPDACVSSLPADLASSSSGSNSSAAARMNRKHKLHSSKPLLVDTKRLKTTLTSDPSPLIPGIKQGSRYEPQEGNAGMTKSELAQWRREARRVRNRESAAASRQKTRDRIDELEADLAAMTRKYQAAMERLQELNGSKAWIDDDDVKSFAEEDALKTPLPIISPPLSPREATFHDEQALDDIDLVRQLPLYHQHQHHNQYHQSMISRPIAV